MGVLIEDQVVKIRIERHLSFLVGLKHEAMSRLQFGQVEIEFDSRFPTRTMLPTVRE